ncbi:MAG: ankyrin repeat domain-containing protein [Pseudomonadota bacterium]
MLRKHFIYALYLVVTLCFSSANAGSYEDFFQAINRNDADTIRALLQRGFDPNSRNPDGQTGLHLALRDQAPRIAQALWTSPALDVDALNASGETPLMMAALRGDLDWAERLIKRGAKIHKDGWSPLHYAATGEEPKLVAMLLDRGAPIDARSPNGNTPLMMAARYGAEASVDLLLARGASKALRNALGQDASDTATLAGREFLLRRLDAGPR